LWDGVFIKTNKQINNMGLVGDTQIVVDQSSLQNAPNLTNTANQSPVSAQNAVKNEASGLNNLLNLGTQAFQIGSTIKYQRQQSGASSNRQSRLAQCGRRPLIGRAKKEAYQKCLDDANRPLLTDTNVGGDINKNIGGGGQSGSMKFVWIGLAIAVAGGIGYMLYKKSK
jgi:hypothetical protein